jgi:hypothetical protein
MTGRVTPWAWDDFATAPCEEDEAAHELHLIDECQWMRGTGTCALVGTEQCEFECPLRLAKNEEAERLSSR